MEMGKVIGTFGEKLKIIIKRMMQDEDLCKMLYYSDKPIAQENVENKMETIFGKHIIYNTDVPYQQKEGSYVLLTISEFRRNKKNPKVLDVEISVDVLVPTKDWEYDGPSLRPFAIIEKISNVFQEVDLEGIGKLQAKGGSLAVAANSMSGYTMNFINYDLGV